MNFLQKEDWCAKSSHLYIVSTPIGNLGDISLRALNVIQSADIVACETVQTTQKLLSCYGIKLNERFTYRDSGEIKSAEKLTEKLISGKSVVLLSDAGTPCISDPGFRIVKLCREKEIPVVPIPGPSALITALSASGLPSDKFFYAGFLSPKKGQRVQFFDANKDNDCTIILYESCHKLQSLLEIIKDTIEEDRIICIAHELTKVHESFDVGTVEEICETFKNKKIKGEYVILLASKKYSSKAKSNQVK